MTGAQIGVLVLIALGLAGLLTWLFVSAAGTNRRIREAFGRITQAYPAFQEKERALFTTIADVTIKVNCGTLNQGRGPMRTSILATPTSYYFPLDLEVIPRGGEPSALFRKTLPTTGSAALDPLMRVRCDPHKTRFFAAPLDEEQFARVREALGLGAHIANGAAYVHWSGIQLDPNLVMRATTLLVELIQFVQQSLETG